MVIVRADMSNHFRDGTHAVRRKYFIQQSKNLNVYLGCSVVYLSSYCLCMVTFVNIFLLWLQVSNCHLRYIFHISGRKKGEGVALRHICFFLLGKKTSPNSPSQNISLYIPFSRTVSCSSHTFKGT